MQDRRTAKRRALAPRKAASGLPRAVHPAVLVVSGLGTPLCVERDDDGFALPMRHLFERVVGKLTQFDADEPRPCRRRRQ